MPEAPKNIDSYQALCQTPLRRDQRIHLNVCGQVTEDAIFLDGLDGGRSGVKVRLGQVEHELAWGDIMEMWPVSVAERMTALKSAS